MDMRDRVFGPIILESKPDHTLVDFGDFVRKLVLAEHFVLESPGLKELPPLVRKFGYDGITELLDSGLLEIRFSTKVLTSMHSMNGTELPKDTHGLLVMELGPKIIERRLNALDDIPGLSKKQRRRLIEKVVGRLVESPANEGELMLEQAHCDVEADNPIVKIAVAESVSEYTGRTVLPEEFSFAFSTSAPPIAMESILVNTLFQIETDLDAQLGLADEDVKAIVDHGLYLLGSFNQRLELMERFEAMIGFRPQDMRLFEKKLAFLVRQYDSSSQEKRLSRVMEIAGLPDVSLDPDTHDVDLSQLIEIVKGDEVRAFRGWLRTIDTMSDQDIRGEIARLRETLRAAILSPTAKMVRFGLAASAGLIPEIGLLAGTATGALDTFILDNVIGKPGPTAFISQLYPSILKS